MTGLSKKTIEEHADFLREYVRLQLWFIWVWLDKHPEEDFSYVIRSRVDIFRKTDLNKDRSKNTATAGDFTIPEWLQCEKQAHQIYQDTKNLTADRFETEAWEVFRREVEARVERDYFEGDGLENYQCGSLRYHPPRKFLNYRLSSLIRNLKRGAPSKVSFHIGNQISPRSIFEDREYLPNCFFQLMEETRNKFHAGTLSTTTWLNSYPRWLDLFPQQWHNNLSHQNDFVDWSQSSWGQFVTARGTFNHKHARMFRETEELPFKSRSSWCSFSNLDKHLRKYLEGKT